MSALGHTKEPIRAVFKPVYGSVIAICHVLGVSLLAVVISYSEAKAIASRHAWEKGFNAVCRDIELVVLSEGVAGSRRSLVRRYDAPQPLG